MDLANVKNHPNRNGFDLSYRNIFTACVGQLIPCMVKDVLPSDKFKINLSWFSRTSPLNTCAYTRIREHVDCFFVPYRLLWRFSDLMFTGTASLQSSFSYASSNNIVPKGQSVCPPCFSKFSVHKLIQANNKNAELNSFFRSDDGGMDRNIGIVKLLDSLGYGDFSSLLTGDVSKLPNSYLNAFRLLAYQKIYSDFYRNEQWEDSKPTNFNVDYFAPGSSQVDVLDNIVRDITSKPLSATSYDDYNNNVFSLRYANYLKDYVTGIVPQPQFDGTSYAPVEVHSEDNDLSFTLTTSESSDTKHWIDIDDNNVLYQANTSGVGNDIEHQVTLRDVFGPNALNNVYGNLSILELRKAQALQRWKEITNCHKKSYKSQLEAHYNVNVSNDRSDMVRYLGGNVQTLNIGEVVNTNLIDSNPTTIGGTGQGEGNANIDFTVPEHGIIMAIYYAEPILDYSTIVDPFNLKTENESFFIPEFDKLGMQPLSVYDVSCDKSFIDNYISRNGHEFLGYVPRYAEYKTSLDKVSVSAHKAFPAWVCPLDAFSLLNTGNNHLPPSEPTPDDVGIGFRSTYQMFKIRPSQLNPIFKAQISPDVHDFMSDQLLIKFNNSIKAIRPMDANGLPY